jgi:putative ABC transport system permease protein
MRTRYQSLAPRYLRAHLKRTLLTILGVVLSVALACAGGLFGESIAANGLQNIRLRSGAFHAVLRGVSATQIERLSAHAKVDSYGYELDAGYASLGGVFMAVFGADPGYADSMHIVVKQGRLPISPGEIALDGYILKAAGRNAVVGETLTLDVVRTTGLSVRRSFTITGFLEPRSVLQAAGAGMAVVSIQEAADILGGGEPLYNAVFTVKRSLPIQQSIREIAAGVGVPDDMVRQNGPLLSAMGEGKSGSINRRIQFTELIIALIILLAAIAVISNTFGISVMERIRQFGLLRCVGATPAQIRSLVMREAVIVCAAGIPIGLACGVLAVQVVIWIFTAMGNVALGGLTLTLSPVILAGSALLGCIAVFLSAIGPALRASRISPLIAATAPVRAPNEKVRRRRHVLAGLFGVSGRMAARNISRSRGRFIVSLLSIGIGVALFVVFSGFMGLMNMTISSREVSPFFRDIGAYATKTGDEGELTEGQRGAITRVPGVKSLLAVSEENLRVALDAASVTDDFRKYAAMNSDPERENMVTVPAALMGLDPEGLGLFRPHIVEGDFDPARADRENGVYIIPAVPTPKGMIRVADIGIGDTLLLHIGPGTDGSRDGFPVKVLGFVDSMTMSQVLDPRAVGFVTTEEVFHRITGKDTFTRFEIGLAPGTDAESTAQAITALTRLSQGVRVADYTESERDARAITLQISILLYGLVAAISLIGALNIVNTIGTSLLLRVREFGMLRAVGMTDRQLRGMVVLEGVLYGLYSSAVGGAIGLLLYRLVFLNIVSFSEIPWIVPWPSIAGACAAAVMLGVLSALVPLRRIGAMSVVESIRAEE